jgi:putative hydrolase of the HAD superfamily
LKQIRYILFDAANTLIHKPELWLAMQRVLQANGYAIPLQKLQLHHKLIAEWVNFPDRTSKEFYHNFNAELFMSLGIVPTEQLLDETFTACSYLPWQRFEDTQWLATSILPIGVLSNFNTRLPEILDSLFGDIFTDIIVSESLTIRKPEVAFYEYAVERIGLPPDQIMYIGDSIKLDMIPAKQVGLGVTLIDRLNLYTAFNDRITQLNFADISTIK